MIITCEKCQTIFELEEARIKGPSARVRCSRCQHVFTVTKDQAGEELDLSSYLEDDSGALPESHSEPDSLAPSSGESEEPDLSSYLSDDSNILPEVGTPAPEPERSARPRPIPASKRRRGQWLAVGGLALLMAVGGGWWYTQRFSVKTSPAPGPSSAAVTGTSSRPAVKLPASGSVPAAQPAQELKNINILDCRVLYSDLKNLNGERLIVIGGKLKNDGPQPRGPIRLRAALTDSDQKPVSERLFYGGTTFSTAELRDLSPEQINQWLDTPGGRPPAHPVVPAGEIIPFTVVFFGAHPTVTGYNLAVVDAPVSPRPQVNPEN